MDDLVEACFRQPWSLLQVLLSLIVAFLTYQAAQRWFLSPWRLGRALRAQGIAGTAYRFPAGDLNQNSQLNAEAMSRPMALCHDIIPRVLPQVHNTVKEHGNICFSWWGPTPKVIIADAVSLRDILSNKHGHVKKFTSKRAGQLLALGIASHDGEKWAKHRRILNPAFHVDNLKAMLPAFDMSCTELVDLWESKLATSDGLFELDVWPEFRNLTGDVISRTAFGSNIVEGRRIFHLQLEQAQRLIQAFQYMYIPGFLYLPTRNNRRMNEINREIECIIRRLIMKRKGAMENGEPRGNDMLGLLMQSNQHNEKEGPMMSTEDMIDECKLFYFAGTDATAVLLTWTLVVLSMHPEWQNLARDEVLSVLGRDKPTFDGLSQLKKVTMILYEVLRLYPPQVSLPRKLSKDIQIGSITCPAGVIIELPIVLVHHNPELWGGDALEFKPERFAEGISKANKDRPAFFPFGWASRICIGQNFALLQAKMALSMILQRFEFQLSPSYTHAPYTVITLHPQHGAQIIFKRL